MQWKWLVKTKLLLAGLVLIVLVGDSMARPGDRRRNRRNQSQQGTMQPMYYTSTEQAAATTQPAASATTTSPQVVMMDNQSGSQRRRGVFGRRSNRQQNMQGMPMQQVVTTQPVAGTEPVAGAQPQPGAEAAPMPAPVATATQGNQATTQRRGLFGRRNGQRMVADQAPVATISGQPATTRQSFYIPNGQSGYIDVRVPVPGAEILFNGARTSQQGINRLYVTPALDPQRDNEYEIEARWTDQAGAPQKQTRTVKVPAGGRIVVDFRTQQ